MSPTPDPTEPDDHGIFDRLDDFKDRIEEAAIQAEFDTGEREETVEEAKAHALVRLGRMTLGTIVVIVGIIALPLPGPGWLIIAGGLTILAKDVAWADRLLRYIRKRVPGIPEDGKIPRSSLVTMALVTLAAVSASMWWTLARGSDDIQAGTYTVTEVFDSTPLGSVGESAPVAIVISDPGLGIEITSNGPITVNAEGCPPIEIAVVERSKAEFVLGEASAACTDEFGSDVIDQLADNTIALNHSTDGIIEWFFADNTLTGINADDEQGELRLQLERPRTGG